MGAIGSYERRSLSSSVLVLEGCREDADCRATVDQISCARVLVGKVEEGKSRIPVVDHIDGVV